MMLRFYLTVPEHACLLERTAHGPLYAAIIAHRGELFRRSLPFKFKRLAVGLLSSPGLRLREVSNLATSGGAQSPAVTIRVAPSSINPNIEGITPTMHPSEAVKFEARVSQWMKKAARPNISFLGSGSSWKTMGPRCGKVVVFLTM